MREIKFRAIIKSGLKEGEWTFGIPYKFKDVLHILPTSNLFVSKEAGDLIFSDAQIILENTLSQFIGMRDLQDKEVYEGDIVEAEVEFITNLFVGEIKREKIIGIIEWNKKGYWQIRTNDKCTPVITIYAIKRIIKVISNIYRNLELEGDV